MLTRNAVPENWQPQPQMDPRVCEGESHEMAEDCSNPCEIFREAISNAFDARAKHIEINLSILREGSRDILRIEIGDDGIGMTRQELQAFFDLGNSPSRDDPTTIGEKGRGIEIYYKSSHIEVITVRDGAQLRAEVQAPYDSLANGVKPAVVVSHRPGASDGTRITIDDYNYSLRDNFSHNFLRDYVLWFTKFGSVEREFGINDNDGVKLTLKGVDSQTKDILTFGHVFPSESPKLDKLLDQYCHEAADFFVKKWSTRGTLKNFPGITWEAVFYLEGDSAKRQVNPMIRGEGSLVQSGMYSVKERYGLWLCKDYIPVQQMNEWITEKGSEFTRFHAFLNCQDFRLTANRGSVMNTPLAVLEDIRKAATEFFRKHIIGSLEYSDLDWLVGQVAAYVGQERDEKDFEKRPSPPLEPPQTTLPQTTLRWRGGMLDFSSLVDTVASLPASAAPHMGGVLTAKGRIVAAAVAITNRALEGNLLRTVWGKMMLWRPWLAGAALVLTLLAAVFFFTGRGAPSVRSQLHLETSDHNGELHIRWNPDAEIVRSATDARLSIIDGDERLTAMLDAGRLKRGAAVYPRRTGRVQLSMILQQAQGRESIATTGFNGGPPPTH
jgi:hypothetical protein